MYPLIFTECGLHSFLGSRKCFFFKYLTMYMCNRFPFIANLFQTSLSSSLWRTRLSSWATLWTLPPGCVWCVRFHSSRTPHTPPSPRLTGHVLANLIQDTSTISMICLVNMHPHGGHHVVQPQGQGGPLLKQGCCWVGDSSRRRGYQAWRCTRLTAGWSWPSLPPTTFTPSCSQDDLG